MVLVPVPVPTSTSQLCSTVGSLESLFGRWIVQQEVAHKNTHDFQENDQGWKPIEVFYGKTPQDSNNIKKTWYSQSKHDQLVIGLLCNKRESFFIDLAANDARKISNTYALERSFGWEGICIEPNPEYWFDLFRFLTCKVVAAIVGRDRKKEIKFN
jgi:hypothetical protein